MKTMVYIKDVVTLKLNQDNCRQAAITVLSGLGCGCATGIIENYFAGNRKDCGCSSC
jgi:hypothetical protein